MENPTSFADTLRQIAGDQSDPVIIISADSQTTHQSVIYTMEAARLAGYGKITFTTQKN
jgi:biopolymer transport protein ExbD